MKPTAMTLTTPLRDVAEQISARTASDGDGVKLKRVFGGVRPERFDPFLMMDEFGSEQAADYIGGFPPHPHRGFETVTYMLQGKMEHRDHMGNIGRLDDSDVQWMTAGRGVIHSEMPRQTEGRMRGFQFWVNLPAARKMIPAAYQDVPGGDIPVFSPDEGVYVKAIAGQAQVNGVPVQGYFNIADTQVVVLDLHLQVGSGALIELPDAFNSLVYVYEGRALLGAQPVLATRQTLTRFTGAGGLLVNNDAQQELRVLVLAGKPLDEPIVQHGPFVMNTVEEIEKAIADYQAGTLTDAG